MESRASASLNNSLVRRSWSCSLSWSKVRFFTESRERRTERRGQGKPTTCTGPDLVSIVQVPTLSATVTFWTARVS